MSRPADAYPEPEDSDNAAEAELPAAPDDAETAATYTGVLEHVAAPEGRDADALATPPRLSQQADAGNPAAQLSGVSELMSVSAAAVDGGSPDRSGDDDHESRDDDRALDDGRLVTARELGLIGVRHAAAETARLSHARAEAISLSRIAVRMRGQTADTFRELLPPAEMNRLDAARFLHTEASAPRNVVRQEDARVEHLLQEPAEDVQTEGHGFFGRLGSRMAEGRQRAEHERWDDRQAHYRQSIQTELDVSRDVIRSRIVGSADEVNIDEHLGLRLEGQTLLPEFFKHLHHQDEALVGRPLSFMEWVSDYATDEQAHNVWQWHDHYLRSHDAAPAYREQVSRVTSGYATGKYMAIEAGELHPSMMGEGNANYATFRHDSPFSPLIAVSYAYTDGDERTVYTRDTVEDYWLYHERTHLDGQLGADVNEGVVEVIANTVFNHVHPDAPRDIRATEYWDNIATVATLNALTEERIGLYGLSQFFAATNDVRINGSALGYHIDNEVGLLVDTAIKLVGKEVLHERLQHVDSAQARRDVHRAMRREAEFLGAMLLDEQGNRIAQTLDDLVTRMASQDTIDRFGIDQVNRGLRMIELTRSTAAND